MGVTPRNREDHYYLYLQILLLPIPAHQSPGARSPTPEIVCCIGRGPGAKREGCFVPDVPDNLF